jgi:apoptosis-inducing factor 3
LGYDEVLVATGGKPKLLPLPVSESQPLLLRHVDDANRLVAAAEHSKNALLIGASFISMEVASAFRERGLNVTIVSRDSIPLVKHLGPEMGQMLLEKHLQKGIRFIPETKVLAINKGSAGWTVKLSSGQEATADLVVSGIGVEPATAFLRNVPLNEDQSLSVDAFMRVSGVKRMFAAGDLANFPLHHTGQRTRIEHWRVAQEQARIAAANMMGLEQPYQSVPYFWTFHYGVRYEFFGQIPNKGELLIDGDLNQSKFVAAYMFEGRCEAFFAANRESQTARLFDYMQREGSPSVETSRAILRAD